MAEALGRPTGSWISNLPELGKGGEAGVAAASQSRYCRGDMPVASKKPKRTNDPELTRSRILDAAARLFHHRGYADTSMQDIIDAASVTSGALHHHYRTKKALGLAVIRERVAPVVEEVWIGPVVDATDPVVGITKAIEGIARGLRRQKIAGCPLNNLAVELGFAEPDFRKEVEKIFRRWRVVLSDKIAESGMCPPGLQPKEAATFIVAAYSGAMTLAKSSQSVEPLKVALKCLTHQWVPQKAA